MDEMYLGVKARYLINKVKKTVIKPVKIDFPLPEKLVGEHKRINTPNKFLLPEVCFQKYKPTQLIGSNIRLSHLLENDSKFIGEIVTVVGWARETRLQAKDTLLFIKLVDGSNNLPLQVVIECKISNWEEIKKAKIGYSFRITGKIEKSTGSKQNIQLKVKGQKDQKIQIYGKCDDEKYPLTGDKINMETLREIGHLRSRTKIISAVTRVKNNVAFATHQFFQNNGFLYIQTPLITAADCQGAGQMFQVSTILPKSNKISDIPQIDGKIDYSKQFFKKVSFLTVSGQLAVESFSCSLSNVYTFGPTFRAEVSHTQRHIAQFWMIEPELAFADLFDTIQNAEAYINFCIKFVLINNSEDLQFLQQKKPGLIQYLKKLIDGPFAKASYTQAIEILKKVQKKGVIFQQDIKWGMDLGSQHQKYLCDHVFHRPVIIYNYPKKIKAFYMRQNDDGETVASFDILAPEIGQIVGGAQRQERLEELTNRIEEVGLVKENYWWYLQLRKYGSVPHGGYGLGFQRLVMMLTGIDNIREISAFPRTPGNCDF